MTLFLSLDFVFFYSAENNLQGSWGPLFQGTSRRKVQTGTTDCTRIRQFPVGKADIFFQRARVFPTDNFPTESFLEQTLDYDEKKSRHIHGSQNPLKNLCPERVTRGKERERGAGQTVAEMRTTSGWLLGHPELIFRHSVVRVYHTCTYRIQA